MHNRASMDINPADHDSKSSIQDDMQSRAAFAAVMSCCRMSANDGGSSQEAGQPSEQSTALTIPAPAAGQAQPHPWAQGRPRAPLAPQQMVAPQRPQGGRGMRPQAAQLPGPPRPHHGHPAHNMAPLPGGFQPGRGALPPFGAPPFGALMPRPPDGGMPRPLPMAPQGRPPFRPPPPHQAPPGWGMQMQPQPPRPPHGFGGPPMARPPGPGMVQTGPGGPAGFLGPPVPPAQPPHPLSQSPWLSAPGGAPGARAEGARPDQHAAERPVQVASSALKLSALRATSTGLCFLCKYSLGICPAGSRIPFAQQEAGFALRELARHEVLSWMLGLWCTYPAQPNLACSSSPTWLGLQQSAGLL